MSSQHSVDKFVDEILSVTPVSTSLDGVSLGVVSSSWGTELERPDEVVGFSEVGSDSLDFVDEILDTDNVLFLAE